MQPHIEAETLRIGEGADIHPTARIVARRVVLGAGVRIGAGVTITGDDVELDARAAVDEGVELRVKRIRIGYKARLEAGSKYRAIGGPAERLDVGDYALLAHSLNVLVPVFRIGDYTQLHNSMLINGYKPCLVGHNCWIGQDTILNSTESLTLGNNVRIGTGSQLWTHVASGELLEGCLLFGEHPLVVEDNVWIVGGAVISPNLVLRDGSIIMVGSVLTKSTEPRHCYAGVPAKDVTDKIPTYAPVTLAQKAEKMRGFVEEWHASTGGKHRSQLAFVETIDVAHDLDALRDGIVVVERGPVRTLSGRLSAFSLETKEYTKKRTELEESFIRFHVGFRARFLPIAV